VRRILPTWNSSGGDVDSVGSLPADELTDVDAVVGWEELSVKAVVGVEVWVVVSFVEELG
jgi:hypothetical protein